MSDATSKRLVVGQKLWFVPHARYMGAEREVVVESVGRKWAAIGDGYRVDVSTLFLDGRGYSSPGRCYLSRELWAAEDQAHAAWGVLRRALSTRHLPNGLTAEQIERATALLGLIP